MRKNNDFDDDFEPDNPFTSKEDRKITNDLITEKDDGSHEAAKAYFIIRKHGLSTKTVKLVRNLNKDVREKLHLSDLEYLLFVMAQFYKNLTLQNLSSILNEKSFPAMIKTYDVMFSMYHRGIFSVTPRERGIGFYLSPSALDFLYSAKDFTNEDKNLKGVVYDIDTLANLYNAHYDALREMGEDNIIKILDRYADIHQYCAVLKNLYEFSKEWESSDYKFLFYITGHLVLNSLGCSKIGKNDDLIDTFANVDSEQERVINRIFYDDHHEFFANKIFDHTIDEGGKADTNCIELHADFKRKYVKDLIRIKSHEDVIRSDNIISKNLFFNRDNQEKIDELTDMLSVKKFASIKKRLAKSGTRTGFIILFSGFPGTGKTELSLQLAKKTGRDIIKVDMSAIRSKWWGEDEKNIKNIFNNYEAVRSESKIEPILLLNEADAIIGKRLDVAGNNGAIISSINAAQNIILDAFDNFAGILIATTNLTANFDKAFERRFLYKIDFDKPNLDVRTQILVSMLKLPEADAKTIAKEFDLSGANIENIYRKMTTRHILYGEAYDLERLRAYCRDEKIEKETHIGFGI